MSQNGRLLNYLETHEGVTTFSATVDLGICRLSERIRELERLGFSFSKAKEKHGNAWVIRYKLLGGSYGIETNRADRVPGVSRSLGKDSEQQIEHLQLSALQVPV